jgi:hypothetical protein
MSLSNTSAKGSERVRHRCGLRACDGYKPACQWRALRTLMPAPAAAASCVLPSISSFLRNTLTCPSVTMELLPAPFHGSAVRTATTGKSNCRGSRAYLKNGGTLEKAAAMANHSSTRTTQLYDRRSDEVTLDEVERVAV